MANFVKTEINDGSTVLNVYAGIDADALAQKVAQMLTATGYSIKEGSPKDGIFERGNRIVRLLMGAFHKYFKFGVRIEDGGNGQVKVRVHKLTSGMSGGLIGMNQVKKELNRIAEELKRI
jgi:hypothetical protein